jgi:hypothetical protein
MSGPGETQATRSIRARTDASIREAEASARPRADLATAIVSLARTSEQRRGARASLIEATDTIAKAIRKELRGGDNIAIPTGGVKAVGRTTVTYEGEVTYAAARASRRPRAGELGSAVQSWHDVLLRDHVAIFGLSDAEGEYVIDGSGLTAYPATAEQRQAFVAEAEAVVKAFRELLEKQAIDYDGAARKATKLSVR